MQVFYPGVVGEESVMTDAVEARGQHVDKKAADKLGRGQGHGLVPITPFGAIVLPLEGDTALITGNETAVADGNPMGVARQVSEYGLGSGERSLGIDHPVDGAQWRQIVGEVAGIGELLMGAEELQATQR